MKRKPRIPIKPTKELVKKAMKLAEECGYDPKGYPWYDETYEQLLATITQMEDQLEKKRRKNDGNGSKTG